MNVPYHGDVLQVNTWNWISSTVFRMTPASPTYTSLKYGIVVNSLREYWMEMGKKVSVVEGLLLANRLKVVKMSWYEVAQRVATQSVGDGCVAVMYNVEPMEMVALTRRIPEIAYDPHRDDVLILGGKTKEAVLKLVTSIPGSVADVIGMDNGVVFCDNFDKPI